MPAQKGRMERRYPRAEAFARRAATIFRTLARRTAKCLLQRALPLQARRCARSVLLRCNNCESRKSSACSHRSGNCLRLIKLSYKFGHEQVAPGRVMARRSEPSMSAVAFGRRSVRVAVFRAGAFRGQRGRGVTLLGARHTTFIGRGEN